LPLTLKEEFKNGIPQTQNYIYRHPKNASHAPFAHLSNKTDSGHHHASYMQDYREHDEELLDTYTSLAITRNPYDRAYSCWNFLRVIEDIEGRYKLKTLQNMYLL
jgi:hypothetical protein